MRKFYLYIFTLFTLFVFKINNLHSQNGLYDISSIETTTTVVENNPNGSSSNYKAFWAQQCSNPTDNYNCGGFEGASGKNVVTPEALNLTLTSTIRNSLNVGGTYTEYADDLNSVSKVNIYMVYLNSSVNWRTNPGEIVFEGEILGVYTDYDQTLYFNGSNFPANAYPVYTNSQAQSKFRDRKFEPNNYNSSSWHCLLYTSPSPRDGLLSRMPSSA